MSRPPAFRCSGSSHAVALCERPKLEAGRDVERHRDCDAGRDLASGLPGHVGTGGVRERITLAIGDVKPLPIALSRVGRPRPGEGHPCFPACVADEVDASPRQSTPVREPWPVFSIGPGKPVDQVERYSQSPTPSLPRSAVSIARRTRVVLCLAHRVRQIRIHASGARGSRLSLFGRVRSNAILNEPAKHGPNVLSNLSASDVVGL